MWLVDVESKIQVPTFNFEDAQAWKSIDLTTELQNKLAKWAYA